MRRFFVQDRSVRAVAEARLASMPQLPQLLAKPYIQLIVDATNAEGQDVQMPAVVYHW